MQLKVFSVKESDFRYGDINGEKFVRFSDEKLRDEYFEFVIKGYRENEGLKEYQPNCFSDKIDKWAYEFEKVDEIIEIHEDKYWSKYE